MAGRPTLFPPELLLCCLGPVPGARCEVVADSRHLPHFEQPEVVNALLKAGIEAAV